MRIGSFAVQMIACCVTATLLAPLVFAAEESAAALRPVVIASDTKWSMRLSPGEGLVDYRGVVSFDEAGTGTGSVLYPAPNAGGLLAAVITHALLVDSARKNQKDHLQAAANLVLAPYKSVLDKYKYRELMQRAVKSTSVGVFTNSFEGADAPSQEIVVESAALFSITQDQKAIILDNVVAIYLPGESAENAYRNTIRVISAPKEANDITAFWTASDGEKLKEESAQLVAKSLDIALQDRSAGADSVAAPFRTIRYQEGGSEKIERAQIVSSQCKRILLRTLRGALMSVPPSRISGGALPINGCGPDAVSSIER